MDYRSRMIMANPPASEADIDALAAQVGAALPEDYKAFLRQASGGRVRDDKVRVPKSGDTVLNDLASATPGTEPNILEDYGMLRDMDRIPAASLPIGDDPAGNAFLLSLEPDSHGAIFFWDHEREAPDGGSRFADFSNVEKIAGSFSDFINALRA